MIVSVTYSILFKPTGSKSVLFPDTEQVYLPDTLSATSIQEISKRLFAVVKATVLDDFNDYIQANPSMKLPGVRNLYTDTLYSKNTLSNLSNLFKEDKPVSNSLIDPANMMKISAGFTKNAIISDYHTEQYMHGIEKPISANLTEKDTVGEMVYLNTICEKAVLLEMNVDGLVPDGFIKDRLDKVELKRKAFPRSTT